MATPSSVNIAVGQVDGLAAADIQDGECFLVIAVGLCRMTTKTNKHTVWKEQFMVRDDDLTASDNRISFELWAIRKWASDSLVAQAVLTLDDEQLASMALGKYTSLRLPLYRPSKVKPSVKPTVPAVGHLTLSVLLQTGTVHQAIAQSLPPDLLPSCSVDGWSVAPATVLHTATGTLYVEPCVVLLRLRLVAARNLHMKPKSTSFASLANFSVQRVATADDTNKFGVSSGLTSTTPGNMTVVSDKLHKQGVEVLGATVDFFTKLRARGKAAQEKLRGDQVEMMAGLASMTGSAAVANLLGEFLPSANKSVPAAAEAGHAPQLTGTAPASLAAGFDAGPHGEHAATSGEHEGEHSPGLLRNVHASGAVVPDDALDVRDSAAAGKSLLDVNLAVVDSSNVGLAPDTSRGTMFYWCQVSYESQSHTTRMVQPRVAESSSASPAGRPAAAASHGTACWDGCESWVMAAQRPVGNQPLELDIYGSTDPKSRGRVVCHMSAPLNDLLLALHDPAAPAAARPTPSTEAGLSTGGSGSDSADVPISFWHPWYDPAHWPRGTITLKGQLEDNSECEVELEVEAVDEDERAANTGVPLLADTKLALPSPALQHAGPVNPAGTNNASTPSSDSPVTAAAAPQPSVSAAVSEPPSRFEVASSSVSAAVGARGAPARVGAPARGGGTLHLILHDFEMDKAADYFIMFQCGKLWGCSSTMPSNARPHWGWYVALPLLRPSELLNVAVFRRNDQKEGKKVVTMNAMLGNAEQMVGKLRIRANTLQPGKLHDVTMPLWGERLQARGGSLSGKVHLSLLLLYPTVAGHVMAYLAPTLYQPLVVLANGGPVASAAGKPRVTATEPPAVATSGPREEVVLQQGSQQLHVSIAAAAERPLSTVVEHPPVEEAVLRRKCANIALGWLEDQSPGVMSRISRRVVDDGRQEFTLSRSRQNLLRIKQAAASLQPLQEWYAGVQSWKNPPLTCAVMLGVLLMAAYPARVLAMCLLLAVLYLLALRHFRGELGMPPPMLDDISEASPSEPKDSDEGPTAAAAVATTSGNNHQALGQLVPLDPFTSLKQQYDHLVLFMTYIQNLLDDIASALEKLQGLANWRDPVATTLFCVGLVGATLTVWLLGPHVLLAFMLLCDLRPPMMRDPMPPPVDCFFTHLPSQSDQLL